MIRNQDPVPFVVRGTGAFPFDMLRYDEAWPACSVDAGKVGMEVRDVRARDSKRDIRMLTRRMHGPTIARWESFGWKVISHERGLPLSEEDFAAMLAAERAGEAAIS